MTEAAADAPARTARRQYALVTGNYWAFTLTDGALRMLVVLHFHALGYTPRQVAMLFLFYEVFGVVTNLVGGWLGARIGLNRTMQLGLGLQVLALAMLLVPASMLWVPWVMAAQALSGIAKDLNKMSAKASLKQLVPAHRDATLFRWVAALTGSKNALKGVGFFLGGALLAALGFSGAVVAMIVLLLIAFACSALFLRQEFGKTRHAPKFRQAFSKSRAINLLSFARMGLFAARDVWFVVALPVFLSGTLGWSFWQVGGFMAAWVIGYGAVQAATPWLLRHRDGERGNIAPWGFALAIVPAGMAFALARAAAPAPVLLGGLALFGVLFAFNSSLHSFLIVKLADREGVALDVGFYYMANALGRLLGTVLSGWVFQWFGLAACLAFSAALALLAALAASRLNVHRAHTPLPDADC